MPKDTDSPVIETPSEPTPTPPTPTPPLSRIKMWFGGSLEIRPDSLHEILGAINTMLTAPNPMYLLEAQPEGEMMIALNDPAIALFGATAIDSTVPRYFSSDWEPERNLSSDRLQGDEFQFQGRVKRFDGKGSVPVQETHKKITDTLWLVTVG